MLIFKEIVLITLPASYLHFHWIVTVGVVIVDAITTIIDFVVLSIVTRHFAYCDSYIPT